MPSTVAGVALGLAFLLLAASLPRVSLIGLYIGLSVTAAAILAWSLPDLPALVWTVHAAQIVVLAAWTIPWFKHIHLLPRLGMAGTGVSYWALGAVGAAITALVEADRHFLVVSGQRVAYLALATFTVLAVVKAARAPDTSVTIGLAAAFLVTLGVLVLAGASNVFERVHEVPDDAAGDFFENRFWGGSGVFYHPVSMAGLAVCIGVRLALDRTLAVWQRVAAVALVPLVIVLTHGRTAALFALAAAFLAVVLHYRDRRAAGDRGWLPSRSTHAVAALVAVSVLVGGTVVFHRSVVDFFTVARYRDSPVAQSLGEAGDITSGRRETWRQVIREFRSDGWSEKLLGSAEHSRAVVVRAGDRTDDRAQGVLIDNAALGALRRGGIVGAVAFAAGLVLLVVHAVRGGPRWFTVAALAGLVTIPFTEWLLGSPLWLLLLGGEATAGSSGDRQR